MIDRTRTRYWTLGLAFLLRRTTPRWFRLFLARAIGSAGCRALPRIHDSIVRNLEIVTGSRSEAARLAPRVFINFCIYIADYVLFPTLDNKGLDRLLTEVIGAENAISSYKAGNGVILVTPHLGNWELGGVFLSKRDYPVNVVSLPEEDARTDAFRNRMRTAHGIRLLEFDPKSASLASMVGMIDVLKKGEMVAMLTDRASAERTETVPFFGHETRFPVGPFILSWMSKAPVVPTYCVLKKDGTYRLVTDRPIELDRSLDRNESLRKAVAEMASRYETYIRRHPDQWYNFYPYFDDPA